jgi:excisionase family DNA binding protein
MPIPKLLTVEEVAEVTRAPVSSVRSWIYCGKLRGRKVGKRMLVAETDLAVFVGEDGGTGERRPGSAASRRRLGY